MKLITIIINFEHLDTVFNYDFHLVSTWAYLQCKQEMFTNITLQHTQQQCIHSTKT